MSVPAAAWRRRRFTTYTFSLRLVWWPQCTAVGGPRPRWVGAGRDLTMHAADHNPAGSTTDHLHLRPRRHPARRNPILLVLAPITARSALHHQQQQPSNSLILTLILSFLPSASPHQRHTSRHHHRFYLSAWPILATQQLHFCLQQCKAATKFYFRGCRGQEDRSPSSAWRTEAGFWGEGGEPLPCTS